VTYPECISMALRKLFEENLIFSLPNFRMCWKKIIREENKDKEANREIENLLSKGKMNSDMAFYSGLALCKSDSTRVFEILENLKFT